MEASIRFEWAGFLVLILILILNWRKGFLLLCFQREGKTINISPATYENRINDKNH